MPRTKRLLSSTGIYHVMVRGINRQSIFVEDRDYSRYIETFFALQMFSSDKKEAVAEFGKFHTEITDSRCLDIDEEKKTPSDKDVRDLALDKYNIDLSKLQNTVQEIQAEIIKYLKKDRGISLRQLSRPTGFTIHRIHKVKT